MASNVLTDTIANFAADSDNVDQANGDTISVDKENAVRANLKRINGFFNGDSSYRPTDCATPTGLTLSNASPGDAASLKSVLEAIDTALGSGGGGGTWTDKLLLDFTAMTSEDYKASDGSKTWADSPYSVSATIDNSGSMGASGTFELDGSDGTANGLEFSHGGDNSGTSGTSGTAPEAFLGFQQLDTDLDSTWPLRVLIEFTLTGSSSESAAGIFIDNDPSLRNNTTNGYNCYGAYVGITGSVSIAKWDSGSLTNSASEQGSRTTANRQYLGLMYEHGAVSVWFGDVAGGNVESDGFPKWRHLEMQGRMYNSTQQAASFDPSTWGLRILFGGFSSNETITFRIERLKVQTIDRS